MFNKKKYGKKYYQENKEKINKRIKKYYQKHKKEINKKRKQWQLKNPEKIIKNNKKWYQEHKKERLFYAKKYQQKHKKEVKKYSKKYYQSSNGKYNTYKNSTKKNNKEWNLSYKEFMTFWQKPCYYCGDKIETIGLDRVNNKKGYSIDNIISCCPVCNFMKHTMTKKEFITQCKKIVKNKKVKL